MVWRTTFSIDIAAEATAQFVHKLLELRAARGTTRIALARVDNGGGMWFGCGLKEKGTS